MGLAQVFRQALQNGFPLLGYRWFAGFLPFRHCPFGSWRRRCVRRAGNGRHYEMVPKKIILWRRLLRRVAGISRGIGENITIDAVPEGIMCHANMLPLPLDLCHGSLHPGVARSLCLLFGSLEDAVSLVLPPVVPDGHTRDGSAPVHERDHPFGSRLRGSGLPLSAGGGVRGFLTWRIHRRHFRHGDDRACDRRLYRHGRRHSHIASVWRRLCFPRYGIGSRHAQCLGRGRGISPRRGLDIGELGLCGYSRDRRLLLRSCLSHLGEHATSEQGRRFHRECRRGHALLARLDRNAAIAPGRQKR